MSEADAVGTVLAVALLLYTLHRGGREGGITGAVVLLIAVGSHTLVTLVSLSGLALRPPVDSNGFYNRALLYLDGLRQLERSGPSTEYWHYLLSLLYTPFGPSHWLGYVVNQWIYLAAVIQLLRFADEAGVGRHRWKIVLTFSLLPSSLLFCNFLMRESLQVLLLIFAVRKLEGYRRTGALKELLLATTAFVPFGAIHVGFFLFAPIAIAATVFARAALGPRAKRTRQLAATRAANLLIATALAGATVMVASGFSDSGRLMQVVEDNIDLGSSFMRASDEGARTVFPWAAPPGIVATALYSPVLLVQFLFAPIVPFMIRSGQDLVASLDTLLRVLFLFGVFRVFLSGARDERRMILFLISIYLLFALLAMAGTTTAGTAMRHHLKVFWIPIVVGAPLLFDRFLKSPGHAPIWMRHRKVNPATRTLPVVRRAKRSPPFQRSASLNEPASRQ